MSQQSKTFSIDEANALIPDLEKCLSHLMEKKKAYSQEHDALFMSELLAQVEHEAGKRDNPFPPDQEVQGFEASIEDFQKDIQAIRDLGCYLRSLDQGLVELCGQWEGQKVFFSWKLGEKEIAYYRSIEEASTDRKPLKG